MITLKVTPDTGEPYTVTATSRDVLMWEKTTQGNKSFFGLVKDPTMVDLYKVAHIASRRQGLFNGSLQEFENSCEVEGETEDEEPDPTQSAHSADDSSSSQYEPVSAPPRGPRKANGR